MKKNIMRKAGILLIAAFFVISSSAVIADTAEKTPFATTESSAMLGNLGNLSRYEEEISYYNPNTLINIIGISGGTPPYYWMSAIRLTQDELAPYVGWNLTKVIVALSCDDGQSEVWARLVIYGEGTPTYPGSIILEQTDLFFDETGFHTIELNESIAIDDHGEIWIAIEWEQTEESAFIPFTDDGPAVDGKGDWVSLDGGATWSELQEFGDPPFDYNWAMGAIVKGDNLPPNVPIITGPNYGRPGVYYTFCIECVDPEGDHLYCFWDWDDGTITQWIGPYASGETICLSHAWSKEGMYTIRVKLKDVHGAESDWATHVIIIEAEPPELTIISPKPGIYVNNQKIIPFVVTIIFGKITISANATDSVSGMSHVDFYIDDVFKLNCTTFPYSWNWSERVFFRHKIKVAAYDNAGNNVTEEMKLWKFF